MAKKPTDKPNWIPNDDPLRINAPDGTKRATGWLKDERPPFQFFNWFYNLLSKWINYFSGNAAFNIIISDDADEADFSSLAAYITTGSPAPGDRVFIRKDEIVTATLNIPDSILVKQEKGRKFIVNTDLTVVVSIGNNHQTEGDIRLELNHTGTIGTVVEMDGEDSNLNNIILVNKSTGTITNAFSATLNAKGNFVKGQIINETAGVITAALTDVSTGEANAITVRENNPNAGRALIWRSESARQDHTLYNIIIDADPSKGDYATFAAYLADAPADGDRVLIRVNEVISSTIVVNNSILIRQEKGRKFTNSANQDLFQFLAANSSIEGELLIETTHTGTIPIAVLIDEEHQHFAGINLLNASTGTITDGIKVKLGNKGIYLRALIISVSGTVTNPLNDISGEPSNDVVVRIHGTPDGIEYSGVATQIQDGVSRFAATAEVTAGTSETLMISPKTLSDELEATFIPAGTRLAFVQASAPTGWTQVTGFAGRGMRLVDGAGGAVAGASDAFLAHAHTSASHSHADTIAAAATALSIAQIPAHTHTFVSNTHLNDNIGIGSLGADGLNLQQNTGSTGSGATHTHTITGGVSSATPGATGAFTPKYVNTIVCSKD